jgi:hypothetical protein
MARLCEGALEQAQALAAEGRARMEAHQRMDHLLFFGCTAPLGTQVTRTRDTLAGCHCRFG